MKELRMQALSSYNSEKQLAVGQALATLADPAQGLVADTLVTPHGLFARFVWPDLPVELSGKLEQQVKELHNPGVGLGLRPVTSESPEWNAAFHGWRSDLDSAQAIYDTFSRHFGSRALWVQSQKDTRGRIEAKTRVEGLGDVTLSLSWNNSSVHLPGILPEQDMGAFLSTVPEIFEWASRRIGSILEILRARLDQLYGERFRGLYVFGSYARPDAGVELPEESDLDVALILSDFENVYDEIKRFGDIVSDLSLEHALSISLVPIREADYRHGRTNFTRVISEYAIPVL